MALLPIYRGDVHLIRIEQKVKELVRQRTNEISRKADALQKQVNDLVGNPIHPSDGAQHSDAGGSRMGNAH